MAKLTSPGQAPARAGAATRSAASMPPYGYMNATFLWDVETRRVPIGFAVDGRQATPVQWRDFVLEVVDELGDMLWPTFDLLGKLDPKHGQWVGNARASVWELTEFDLDLMATEPLKSKLTAEARGAKKFTHKELFLSEDEALPSASITKYDTVLAADLQTRLVKAMDDGLRNFGPAPLRFKELLQRPRPYQMAFMLRRPFEYQFAKSAVTPSMISGHAIQGLVSATSGYMAQRLALDLEGVVGGVELLATLAADIGDRRVHAGVHYPSDNLASWWLALRLCDHLYGEAGRFAKAFVTRAIRGSEVYKALAEAKSPPPIVAGALARLGTQMAQPARRTEP